MAKAPDIVALAKRNKNKLVQLCLPLQKVKGELSFPLLASEKLDGVYGLACCTKDNCYIYSRTGEEYKSLEHIKPELWELAKLAGVEFIIFEAYARGLNQPTISGFCRDTKKQHTEISAYVHDCLTEQEFFDGLGADYAVRASRLKVAYMLLYDSFSHTNLIQQCILKNEEELQEMARAIWAKGGEGVVARNPKAQYEPGKRNKNMIKVKQGVSFDLKVVGVEEGEGKYKGMVGKLICSDSTGKQIKVGSGLNDEERKIWWTEEGYKEVLGKIVQVDAMAVSTKGVLREPRYKGIRYDKTQEDEIKC